jgi:hypothetical protein
MSTAGEPQKTRPHSESILLILAEILAFFVMKEAGFEVVLTDVPHIRP